MRKIEERITRLEDIESIRYLQAKYQRSLDTRDFDALAECFSEDVVSSYGNGKMSYCGKEAVLDFLIGAMTPDMPSTHLIHGGEIDILSTTTAKAKWYLEDYLLHQKYKMKLHGAAIYEVEYVKMEASGRQVWLIKSIGYKRCYEYMEMRGVVNLVTLGKKTFINAIKKCGGAGLGHYGELFYKRWFHKGRKC